MTYCPACGFDAEESATMAAFHEARDRRLRGDPSAQTDLDREARAVASRSEYWASVVSTELQQIRRQLMTPLERATQDRDRALQRLRLAEEALRVLAPTATAPPDAAGLPGAATAQQSLSTHHEPGDRT